MDPLAILDNTPILDWDNHRDGIFMGYVDVQFGGKTREQKLALLLELIRYIQGRRPDIPEGAALVKQKGGMTFDQLRKELPLKSVNLRVGLNDELPDHEARLFVMGEPTEMWERYGEFMWKPRGTPWPEDLKSWAVAHGKYFDT